MLVHVSTAGRLARFWRAGLEFTAAGRVLDAAVLPPGDLERIEAEPNLTVRPATAEEARPFVLDAVLVMIPQLAARDFGANGAPHLKALRDVTGWGDAVTKEIADEAMAALTAQGFAPPKEPAKG